MEWHRICVSALPPQVSKLATVTALQIELLFFFFFSLSLGMPRLVVDLNTAQCPDYLLDIYHAVWIPFVTPNSNHIQANAILTMVWEVQNTVERQQWLDQSNQDVAEVNERWEVREEMERMQQEEADKEKEEQWKEERKKNKAKFVPIPPRGVPTTPLIIVSAIATWRMDKGDYVPLWYFTNASLDDAAKAFSIMEEDVLALVRRDDGSTSLVPALSSKDSRSMIEDNNLPWDDFCIVVPHMISAMSWSEWPPECITMMTEFWTNINMHPYRSSRDLLDQSALPLYQKNVMASSHQLSKAWTQSVANQWGAAVPNEGQNILDGMRTEGYH